MSTSRFTKIGADGQPLPDDATEWVVNRDNTTGLEWPKDHAPKRMTWKQAKAWVKKLTLCGHTDWRLPTVEELFMLADRTKHAPAIDTDAFPACESDWYWTSTPAAYSPVGYAWSVFFGGGVAGWVDQGYFDFVRAVRASQ